MPDDDRLSGLLRAAVAQRTFDQPPDGSPPVAIGGAVRLPVIQRSKESEALLTKLADPRFRPGPAVDVQKALVYKLDVEHADEFSGGLINLGGVLIEEIPDSDDQLIAEAQLVALPTAGGFISAGSPRAAKIKELGFDRLVVQNTLQTMIAAKQIKYLRLAGLPNEEWKILVELHYYRERDMTATGFHKDTLGETLFVNLNYHMDKQVIGPEVVVNPPPSAEHDEQTALSLPESFRADLTATRKALGDPDEYQTGLVEAVGAHKVDERTQGRPAGFHAVSIPKSGKSAIRPKDKPPLKRRSSNADFRKTLPPEPDLGEKRCFFRTWVRVVPTSKAHDLRRRVDEAERLKLEATTNVK